MNKTFKSSFLTIYLCCASIFSQAQQSTVASNQKQFDRLQDSLVQLSSQIVEAAENTTRFENNARFIKTLVQSLHSPEAFDASYENVKMISTVKSPDNSFKLYTWFVQTDEGSYRYFGTIQMPPKNGKLQLFPLIDASENFPDSNAVTDPKQWFGSRYYEIVPVKDGKDTYYALLGWKGNSQKTSSKVIEVLSFKNGVPVFGKPVFEVAGKLSSKNRMIYTYNKMNSMTLRFDKKVNMIVCDHLAPYDPAMKGNYEFYASDSSFDGYALVKGKLKLVEDIEVNNDSDDQDDFYIDPARKDIPAKKKF